ncbi:MAG: BON domain-containing protein [Zetaproteobacteria bacterium]|nr:BON domain-containing protein [Zetaproteobacteria bacterium]
MRISYLFYSIFLALMLNGCSSSLKWVEEKSDASKTAYEKSETKVVIDDAWIATQIDSKLLIEPNLPYRGVSIQVVNGEVLLTGVMPTQNHINQAMTICQSVKGVRHVDSRLQLGEVKMKSLFTDAIITAKIKARLLDDPVTPGWAIRIKTEQGRVYLRGEIRDPAERYRARSVIEKVEGVTAIVDMLRLRP